MPENRHYHPGPNRLLSRNGLMFLSEQELGAERRLAEGSEQLVPPQQPEFPDADTNVSFEGEERDMPETAWWLTTPIPDGFIWVTYPDGEHGLGRLSTRGDHPQFVQNIQALQTWAEENGLEVRPYGEVVFFIDIGLDREPVRTNRPFRFCVGLPDPTGSDTYTWDERHVWRTEFVCPHCAETHPAYTAACGTLAFTCSLCASTVENVSLNDVQGMTVCTDCTHECDSDGCETLIAGSERDYCEEHRIEAYCVHCDAFMERHIGDAPFFHTPEGPLCENCRELLCENCNRFYRRGLTWSSDLGMNVCSRCLFVGADGTTGESFDDNADMTNSAMQIPTIPGRENVRECGIEIEGANGTGGGNALALAFYESDLSLYDSMTEYHHGSGGGFVHVERDSSVDWEVVIGPLNPANRTHVRNLNSAVRIIRENVKSGVVGLDLRAGCHIHVEAARTSLGGAFNLNTLFAYLEDVIFRLAAARWPVHRAIMDAHYTAPVPKGLRKMQFARTHDGSADARYYALSFQNYFSRVLNNCHCGAVRYDSWEECECELGKCTFEFRVFNTTANPRKLHAYMALAQALVAKAMSLGDLDNANEQFPALEFRTRRFKDMPEAEQEEITGLWRDRLAWMFNELPLTDPEKESLAYCIRHSELDTVGEEFIGSLLPAQQIIEEAIA